MPRKQRHCLILVHGSVTRRSKITFAVVVSTEVFVPLEHPPMLRDFGEALALIDGEATKVHLFVGPAA